MRSGFIVALLALLAAPAPAAEETFGLLDITPYGRQEDFEDSPEGWPQQPTYG